MPRSLRVLALLCAAPALAGCLPAIAVSRHLDTELDHPRTLIEKALSSCPSRSEEAESVCVKQALIDGRVTVAALPGLIAGCRIGRDCTADYTTEDRIGFLPATASDYRVHWRVTIDLTHPGPSIDDIPVAVEQV